ncbi:MAG: sugar phosphate nucleotidyltransferase [Ginsengibacter sp.]
MKAMILAAGLGTRLKPFTDKHPKALAEVNGKTILQRNIEYLHSFGFRNVIINVHHFADQIIKKVKDNNGFGSLVYISDEREEVLETGGGLLKAKWFFEKETAPFAVMNVDVLTDLNFQKMYEQHISSQALITLAVRDRITSRYLLFDKDNLLCGWQNIKTGEKKLSRQNDPVYQKAFSGIQIISPGIFHYIKQTGKFSLIDLYLSISAEQKILAYDHTADLFIDVGTPEKLLSAGKIFN